MYYVFNLTTGVCTIASGSTTFSLSTSTTINTQQQRNILIETLGSSPVIRDNQQSLVFESSQFKSKMIMSILIEYIDNTIQNQWNNSICSSVINYALNY